MPNRTERLAIMLQEEKAVAGDPCEHGGGTAMFHFTRRSKFFLLETATRKYSSIS